MRLNGRRGIITGASRGLGSAIASAMWSEGAKLLLVARSAKDLAVVRDRLLCDRYDVDIHILSVDLAEKGAPNLIISEARRLWPTLDIVVNNAGILGPIGMVADNDWELWRQALQVNLLAPAELCHLSIGWMRETGRGGSIVNLSGGGAANPRPRFSAYGASKCGLVRFSETIAAEVAPLGIRVNCVAPGAMNTELLRQTLLAGPDVVGNEEYEQVVRLSLSGGTDPQVAASLAVYLASDEAIGITGRLISAVWDPWSRLHNFVDEIKMSDIYTLRRILPEDRGRVWSNV